MGELPDAYKYMDQGSNTLGNIAAQIPNFLLPNLERLGLGNIDSIKNIAKCKEPIGCYARMSEKSTGKDTITGHWEMAGITLRDPLCVYPKGFPKAVIKEFEDIIGTKTLGNIIASGTEIINQLGHEHMKTGYPIIYTSSDSVFQIAVHEDVVPVDKLYDMCKKAREILKGDKAVGRIIARPFITKKEGFERTDRRRDFSLKPPSKTLLSYAKEAGYQVVAVGKINDIFAGEGITKCTHTTNDMDGVNKTLEYINQQFEGIIFTNLVDFDTKYGHRNDVEGYANALRDFDKRIPELIESLTENDILFITADHGCDPTTTSTDHSREYVPLLIYGKRIKKGVNLHTRLTFADIAATIAEYLNIQEVFGATSFYTEILLDKEGKL